MILCIIVLQNLADGTAKIIMKFMENKRYRNKNIIRLQEKFGFKLIHFSSSEVYGDYPNIMLENVMDDYEIKQLNDYAMSKWVNEMQIKNSAIQYGTESVVVRIFNTYGPGEYYSPYRSVNCRFLYCALKV